MASKEFDGSSECDSDIEPSVTNTHCFFWRASEYTSPTYTTNAARSNSLMNKCSINFVKTSSHEHGDKAEGYEKFTLTEEPHPNVTMKLICEV